MLNEKFPLDLPRLGGGGEAERNAIRMTKRTAKLVLLIESTKSRFLGRTYVSAIACRARERAFVHQRCVH